MEVDNVMGLQIVRQSISLFVYITIGTLIAVRLDLSGLSYVLNVAIVMVILGVIFVADYFVRYHLGLGLLEYAVKKSLVYIGEFAPREHKNVLGWKESPRGYRSASKPMKGNARINTQNLTVSLIDDVSQTVRITGPNSSSGYLVLERTSTNISFLKRVADVTWAPLGLAAFSAVSGYFAWTHNELGFAISIASAFAFLFPTLEKTAQTAKALKSVPITGSRYLKEQGCEWVYSSRREAMPDITNALVQQLMDGSGSISILAISARDILHFDRVLINRDTSLLMHLRNELNREASRTELRMLILNPGCEEAERRARLENTEGVIREINFSISNYRDYFSNNSRVNLGLYSLRPWRFMLLTDELAFVQDYLSAPPENWEVGNFGDLECVYRYRAGSLGYRRAVGEFLSLKHDDSIEWIG